MDEDSMTCERCQCIDFSGTEGVTARADVRLAGVGCGFVERSVRLCNFCYGRVNGSEPDPMERDRDE